MRESVTKTWNHSLIWEHHQQWVLINNKDSVTKMTFLCLKWEYIIFAEQHHSIHRIFSAVSSSTIICFFFLFSVGCLQPSAVAAWRKLPPRSSWCVPWSASTTWTASAAACATGSWGRATSLSWRRASCCARSTTRGRKIYSARLARMTQTQVSPLHPLTHEWDRHHGAIITWRQGVVFCMLRSITWTASIGPFQTLYQRAEWADHKVDGSNRTQYDIHVYDICRILKKVQIIENLSETLSQIVYKGSHNSTTHKFEWFLKGVWWNFSEDNKKWSPHWLIFVVFVHFVIFTINGMSHFINVVRWWIQLKYCVKTAAKC